MNICFIIAFIQTQALFLFPAFNLVFLCLTAHHPVKEKRILQRIVSGITYRIQRQIPQSFSHVFLTHIRHKAFHVFSKEAVSLLKKIFGIILDSIHSYKIFVFRKLKTMNHYIFRNFRISYIHIGKNASTSDFACTQNKAVFQVALFSYTNMFPHIGAMRGIRTFFCCA